MEPTFKQQRRRTITQGIIFGLIFGFLLQKGGVAKYSILVNQLLLKDFTVMKVMLSAIFVGAIGLFFLHKNKKIEFHIKPTRVIANITGGLIFGIGFACSGYCPGTGAAALGQGNLLAVYYMIGLVAGSYVYAEFSSLAQKTIEKWYDFGKLTIHSLLKGNRGLSVLFIASIILISLISLKTFHL